ncbi:MAG: TonB-dependent receptor [Acidobacteriota bacterium]
MTRQSTFVAAAAVVVLVMPASPVLAQDTGPGRAPVIMARASQGSIQGLVLDSQGRPLVGAMVSALGSAIAFALTDRDGRFRLDALPTGAYTVRIHHDGFVPSSRRMIEVRPSAPAILSVTMQAQGAAAEAIPVLAAGVMPFAAAPASADMSKEGDVAETHSHSETAWRLRHLKRSVLKDAGHRVDTVTARAEPEEANGTIFGRAFESSLRFAASLVDDLALSGEVNFVTSGAFDDPGSLWSPGALTASNVTYVSLQAPAGGLGTWAVQGAMTRGDVASWFLTGSVRGLPSSAHRYRGGFAYGAQRYVSKALFSNAAIWGGSRSAGLAYGFDEWALTPRVTLDYGLAYAWQDYIERDALFSPRVALSVKPGGGIRVRTLIARRAQAPGSEELIPPSAPGDDTLLLPAQRTFSAWSPDGFRPQTTEHYEVVVERDFADYLVGFRTFYQRVDDQAGAVFALPTLERPAASLGHYYVAAVGDVEARGWGLSVAHSLASMLRGSVDYSQTSARWTNIGADSVPTLWTGWRPRDERVHDVTTSLETDFSRTSTRVFVLYKLNTGFARGEAEDSGLDTRFDVQVNQALPFLDFTSAQWEVLVAVRNVFHDPTAERSVYDELLVVRPPKRIVGGVRVRF